MAADLVASDILIGMTPEAVAETIGGPVQTTTIGDDQVSFIELGLGYLSGFGYDLWFLTIEWSKERTVSRVAIESA